MSLAHISIAQAVDVWADLEDALRGENGFGGDTAEIYAYRLMAYVPTVHRDTPKFDSSAGREAERSARVALCELIELFMDRHECSVTVNGFPLRSFRSHGEFTHRAHVRVLCAEAEPAEPRSEP